MRKIIDIFLSNMTQRAQRLGLDRRTLYAWKSNPKQANLDLIEKDLRALLALIEEERGKKRTGREVFVIDDSLHTVSNSKRGEIKLLNSNEFYEFIEILLTSSQMESFIASPENRLFVVKEDAIKKAMKYIESPSNVWRNQNQQ